MFRKESSKTVWGVLGNHKKMREMVRLRVVDFEDNPAGKEPRQDFLDDQELHPVLLMRRAIPAILTLPEPCSKITAAW